MEHLVALSDEFERFLRSDPYRVRGEYVAERSVYRFTCDAETGPPFRLGLLVGDAVHNIYATLDHLVWGLAGGKGSRQTQFLIAPSRKQFELRRQSCLGALAPSFQDFIESLQPYHAKSFFAPLNLADPPHEPHALEILRALDNVDKHRLFHTTVAVVHAAAYGVTKNEDAGDWEGPLAFALSSFESGSLVAKTRIRPAGLNPVLHVTGDFALRIAFDFRPPVDPSLNDYAPTLEALHERDIFETVADLHSYVEAIVDAAELALITGAMPQMPPPEEVTRSLFDHANPEGKWMIRVASDAAWRERSMGRGNLISRHRPKSHGLEDGDDGPGGTIPPDQ